MKVATTLRAKSYLVIAGIMVATVSGLAIAQSTDSLPVFAQQQSTNGLEKSSVCEMRVTLLNNRSKLLLSYQKNSNQKYVSERNKAAKRISYAGKWVPQEAESAREKLYYLDTLHRNLDKELEKQIDQYRYLESQPLDCSTEKRAELIKKLKEVNGVENKQVVSGQSLIEKLENQEKKYMNGDFEKDQKTLVEKLHQKKAVEPYNKNQMIEVTDYKK